MIPHRILQHLPALTLALAGLAIIIVGRSYTIGTLTNMGPGFMPVLGGSVLLILVLAQALGGGRGGEEARSAPPLRPLLFCGGSLLCWALLAEPAGLLPASMAQMLLAHAALPQASWKAVFLSSAVITLLAYVLFVVFLGIPLEAVG